MLMNSPVQIGALMDKSSVKYFKGSEINNVFLSLKILFILEKSLNPGEMAKSTTFYPGFLVFRKYAFTDFLEKIITTLRSKSFCIMTYGAYIDLLYPLFSLEKG